MPELLTADEKEWLNAYNVSVYTRLAPRMTPEEAAWLAVKTRQI